MIQFPIKFEVQANSSGGIKSTWTAQSALLPPIPSAIPPEFSGPGGGYSPEDLFALAVLNCLIATYKVYCEKSQVRIGAIQGRAVLTVDKNPGQAGFAMTHLDIFLDVREASDPEKGRRLLDAAIKDCAVSNSIKSGKTFHINVS